MSPGLTNPVEIHFDDLDPMGIVHNSRYALLVERVMAAFWAEHGYQYTNGGVTRSDAFNVVAEFNIRYFVPIRGTGTVHVQLWVEHLGSSSARYAFRVTSVDGSVTHAEGYRVNIKLDQATLRPTPWTEESRAIATTILRSPEKVA